MSNATAIEQRTDHAGRTLYVVGGIISTYNAVEADSLASTGIMEFSCPLMRELAAMSLPFVPVVIADIAPNGHGDLEKFPWE